MDYSENETTTEDLANSTMIEIATNYSKGETDTTKESATNMVSEITSESLKEYTDPRGKVIFNVGSKKFSYEVFTLFVLTFIMKVI